MAKFKVGDRGMETVYWISYSDQPNDVVCISNAVSLADNLKFYRARAASRTRKGYPCKVMVREVEYDQ